MSEWIAFVSYALVMSITPGPNNVMVLSSGANFGLRRTMPHILGITYGFTLQTLAVCTVFGLAWHHLAGPPAWLSWVGAAYLAYLAFKLLRSGPVGTARVAKPLTLWEGMIFQAVNPKAWIMALTTASVFVPKLGDLRVALLLMGLVLILINLPCVTTWAACGDALRKWLESPRRRMVFNGIMGALLLLTAWHMVAT
ncbi:MAG: LysE family translocator [Gammaproteobacteria bacterium]